MSRTLSESRKTFPNILRYEDPEGDYQAYVVIDSLLQGRSAGGIRMTCDVSETEVAELARNMTLKFGFANVYYGGAKSGICIQQPLSQERRQKVLETFGQQFAKVIQSRIYQPAEDIGTGPEDVLTVLKAAGCTANKGGKSLATSSLYTAWSIVASTEKLSEDRGLRLEGARWILEGFGKVGAEIARQFKQKGMKLLAISTRAGALFNQNGLDIENLLVLQKKWGDDCVNQTIGNQEVTLDRMLQLEADILILAGKSEALHIQNVNKVKASIIVPGGNLSITTEAEQKLTDQGHVILPDFVTNSGGVLGLGWKGTGVLEDGIRRLFKREFGKKVKDLLALSKNRSEPVRAVAEFIAVENIKRMRQEVERRQGDKSPGIVSKVLNKPFHWVLTQLLRILINSGVPSKMLRYAYAKAIFWADKPLYQLK